VLIGVRSLFITMHKVGPVPDPCIGDFLKFVLGITGCSLTAFTSGNEL